MTNTKNDLWARILCSVFFLLGIFVLGHKYYYFGYYDWDLALYSHVLWNMTHGSLHSSLFDAIFLSNHAEYIAFLIAPLYALFPHSFTLIVLKLTVYSFGAYTLFKITEKITDSSTGLILTAIYLFYPANIFMLFYEFHFENLATGLIFALYYFFLTNRIRPYIATTIALILIKENVALIPIMFGIYALISKKSPKTLWGILPIILSIAVFYINTNIVIPYFRNIDGLPGAHGYLAQYSQLGSNYSDILTSAITSPLKIADVLFSQDNLTYLSQLLLPLGLFPLTAPQILLLGAPIALQHLLSNSSNMHSIVYHYAATLVPFIFLATAHGLSVIKARLRVSFYQALILLLVLGSIWIHLNYRQSYIALFNWVDAQDTDRRAILKEVPPHASTITTFPFMNALIQREKIFAFFDAIRDLRPLTGKPFDEKNIQYALIDWNDNWIRAHINSTDDLTVQREILQRVWDLVSQNNFSVVSGRGEITLLENNPLNPIKLITVNKDLEAASETGSLYQNTEFIVTGQKAVYEKNKKSLRLTMRYKSLQNIDQFYSAQIKLKQDGQIVYTAYHLVGYAIYPTLVWLSGDTVTETYEIPLPATQREGNYTLEISFEPSPLIPNEYGYTRIFADKNAPDLQITNLQFN